MFDAYISHDHTAGNNSFICAVGVTASSVVLIHCFSHSETCLLSVLQTCYISFVTSNITVTPLSYQVITLASLLAAASAKPGLSQSYQAPGSSFGGSAGAASFLRPAAGAANFLGPAAGAASFLGPAAGPAVNFGGAASGGVYNPPVSPVTRPHYNFNYAVNDAFGNDFGHQEGRDGYNTQGSYYVQLPDGRLQRVTYTVNGDQGYVAQVTYEGVAQYPAFQPSASYSPAPSYG
ncbi:cuticle protein 19.8-like [Penaeus monodon]|uniref:cuticle protein 19.8-like n=1 Tax=Penaeus monodon TaxID=6687 RepID=UPI0018A78ABF|nr:cuticle protein 19.8-like [Penaeus monodon]